MSLQANIFASVIIQAKNNIFLGKVVLYSEIMNKNTKETLKRKEAKIIDLIATNNKAYIIFYAIYICFLVLFRINKSNVFPVFESIYIKKSTLCVQRTIRKCHISRTTYFDIRKEIIDTFYCCYEENFIEKVFQILKQLKI